MRLLTMNIPRRIGADELHRRFRNWSDPVQNMLLSCERSSVNEYLFMTLIPPPILASGQYLNDWRRSSCILADI